MNFIISYIGTTGKALIVERSKMVDVVFNGEMPKKGVWSNNLARTTDDLRPSVRWSTNDRRTDDSFERHSQRRGYEI